MAILHNTLLNYAREQNDDLAAIVQAIKMALEPWDAGGATIELMRYIDKPDQIRIETRLLPELPFIFPLDPYRDRVGIAMLKRANEAYMFFRNRPTLPIDDHIVLGEN